MKMLRCDGKYDLVQPDPDIAGAGVSPYPQPEARLPETLLSDLTVVSGLASISFKRCPDSLLRSGS